jgi:hypothetical protein
MGDAEDDWAVDRFYGSEPSAAPPTETLVAGAAEMPRDAMGPDAGIDLNAGDSLPGVEEQPDVNAGDAQQPDSLSCSRKQAIIAAIDRSSAMLRSRGYSPILCG